MAKPVKSSPYKTNLQKVRERYEETSSDNRWLKIQPDSNVRIRILPPWGESAEGMFFYSAALHYGFQIGGQNRAIPCTGFSKKGPCPVCMLREALLQSGDSNHAEIAKRIARKPKYWVNVVMANKDGSHQDNVQIYGGNKKFINTVLGLMDDPDYGDLTDPGEEGRDFWIKRKGSGFTTRYEYSAAARASELSIEGWEEKLHQLDKDVVEWMTFGETVGHIKTNFADEVNEIGIKFKTPTNGDAEDDGDDKLKTKVKLVKKTKPVEEDDDDDLDDEDEE